MAVSKYVSVASLTFTALIPVLMLVMGYQAEAVGVGFAAGGLCWFKHRGNIRRLLKGEERRFSFKKEVKNE